MINYFENHPLQPLSGTLAVCIISGGTHLLIYGVSSLIYSHSNLAQYAKIQRSKFTTKAIGVTKTLASAFAISSIINLCFDIISLYSKTENYFAISLIKALSWIPMFRYVEYVLSSSALRHKYLYDKKEGQDSGRRTEEYQNAKTKLWQKLFISGIISVVCKSALYYAELAHKIHSGYQWIGLAICIEIMRQSAFYKWNPQVDKLGKKAQKPQEKPWYNNVSGIVYKSAISELLFDHIALDLAPKILPKIVVDTANINPISIIFNSISLTTVQSLVYSGLYQLESSLGKFLSKWRVKDYNHAVAKKIS